jgi:cyclophilin family peptidyl-prolyl cis-trans isomerase
MNIPIKTLLTLLVATVIFSACQPPKPDLNLKDPTATPEASGDESLSAGTLRVDQLKQTQSNQGTETMPAKTTKTLADFKVNPAKTATLKTSKGDITIDLFRDEAPLTTANFVDLASTGFYNSIVFHRVIPDFMAQVGDPLTKDPAQQARWGTGGPGYTIADEFSPALKHESAGIVSMANSGPNTGGSQFFITFAPTEWLDGKHAVFGKVTAGMDVLMQIAQGDTILAVELQ